MPSARWEDGQAAAFLGAGEKWVGLEEEMATHSGILVWRIPMVLLNCGVGEDT